jgi:hypothetical protein
MSLEATPRSDSADADADADGTGPPAPVQRGGVAAARTEAPSEPVNDPSLDGSSVGFDPDVLKEVADDINRDFPLVTHRSGVVLYDVDPEQLQAQWAIKPDDFVRAHSAFPASARGVRAVLRLLRVDAHGGAPESAVSPLQSHHVALEGSSRFTVNGRGALFQAELGVISDDGGWLLLARSNRVRMPGPAGQPAPIRAAAATAPKPAEVMQPGEASPSGSVRPEMDAPKEPRAVVADPTLSEPTQRLEPIFPNPLQPTGRRPTMPFPRASWVLQEVAPGAAMSPLLVGPQTPFGPLRPGAAGASSPAGSLHADTSSPLPPPLLPSTHTGEGWKDGAGLPVYEPRGAVSSGVLHGRLSEKPAVEVHADLLVYGSAHPGSLVSIFGHSLRVGLNGRFSMRRPLDDPRLLGLVLSRIARRPASTSDAE